MTTAPPDRPLGSGLAFADESSVVSLARAGDRPAFAELLNRRQSSIRNLLRRLSRDPVLADDLAQETFLEAWRQLSRLRASGAFGGWLRQIAVSKWLQHVRSARAFASELENDANVSEGIDGVSFDLDAALARLLPDARLCVVLSYYEGMSHSEIVSATGLPLGTVKSHILRGATQLRSFLDAYDHRSHP